LVTLKNNFELLHPSERWSGTAIVAADRDTSFRALKNVLYACHLADYPNVDFVVRAR